MFSSEPFTMYSYFGQQCRKITNDMIQKYTETLVKNQVKIQYDIVLWNPFDTNETMATGVDFLRKLPKADDVAIYELKVLPGSKLHSMVLKQKPKYLPNEDYEYWGWVFTMILRSCPPSHSLA